MRYSFSQFLNVVSGLCKILLQRGWFRQLACFAVIFSLIYTPGLGLGLVQLPALAASAATSAGDSVKRIPALFTFLLGLTADEQDSETLADRRAQVARVRVSPARYVGYSGDTLTFDAIGTNFARETVQGVAFDNWESSDPSTVEIDATGRATFLRPGSAVITCSAGAAAGVAQILVRPGRRPRQTDAEWKVDQDLLPDTESSSIGGLLPSLFDKLAPTAYAQGGGYSGNDFGYNELWSEPRNLVGAPGNRAIEPASLGPVLPEGSNFNFSVPLIGLGGRGVGAALTLYYNSRVWSRHGNAVTFSPVGGFPFAGFSAGFGRVLTYGTPTATSYVFVEPDGTRHYLGTGNSGTSTTYNTTDGSNLTFVYSTGGRGAPPTAIYYPDGTQLGVTLVNNRYVVNSVKDTNGNYVSLSYKSGVLSLLAIDFVTDTQGRKIQFNYNPAGNLISITAPGYGGTAGNPVTRTVAQFDYQSRTLGYNFSGLTVENAPTGAVEVLRHIYFPATNTGSLFTYSDYGMIHDVSNRRQMTIDGNGVISDGVESASVEFNYPTAGSTQLTDVPAFTQRTETTSGSPTGTYTYSATTDSLAQTMTFIVGRPDSSTLKLTRSTNVSSLANGLMVQSEVKNNVGSSMAKSVLAYVNDSGGEKQVQSVIAYDDTNTPAKVDSD